MALENRDLSKSYSMDAFAGSRFGGIMRKKDIVDWMYKVFCKLNILRYLPEDVKQQFIDELYPFIEKIKDMPDSSEWQLMGKTLPKVGEHILICDIDGDIYFTHRVNISSTKFEFYDEWGDKIKNIVAWMPLPQPYHPDEK